MDPRLARIAIRVTGVVQGVGYRPFAYARATDLGITAIGKNVKVPNGLKIGRGVTVEPDVAPEDFPPQGLEDGAVMRTPKPARGEV